MLSLNLKESVLRGQQCNRVLSLPFRYFLTVMDQNPENYDLTLFDSGGPYLPPTIMYLRIRVCVCVYTSQFFVTFPHFECGRGYNSFGGQM